MAPTSACLFGPRAASSAPGVALGEAAAWRVKFRASEELQSKCFALLDLGEQRNCPFEGEAVQLVCIFGFAARATRGQVCRPAQAQFYQQAQINLPPFHSSRAPLEPFMIIHIVLFGRPRRIVELSPPEAAPVGRGF